MKKDWFEELAVVSADLPGQVARMEDLIVQHGFQVISFGLKRDAKAQELEATFQLKVRAVKPQREILQDLLEMEGVRAVNLA
jgi:ACT domain-containing protein